jgi:hypothetical protein
VDCDETEGAFSQADVEAGPGVLGCGGGGAAGVAWTGVAHCGQTMASSGMEAPHLKQNIHTSFGFPVAGLFLEFCSGKVLHSN